MAVKEIPAYSEGQVLAHVSLNAALSGDSGGRGGLADAKVEVKDAHVKLSDDKRRKLQSLRTPDDVVIVDDGRPIDRAQAKKLKAVAGRLAPSLPPQETAAQQKAAKETNPAAGESAPTSVLLWKRITIAVTAPDKLWVNGGGAALELGLAPGFRIVIADETHLHGEVIVRRGRVDALGRRFDLKADSSLQFEGAPDHPTLDATAQYQDNEDNVTVLVTAKGPIDHLTIGVSSPNRPDLNQSQLYTLIITGHLPSSGGGSGGGLGATAQNEAASLVAGVIAGSLQKTLAKHLPLDVLTIDTGGEHGADGDAARGRPLRHRQALRRLRRADRRRSDAVPESKRRPRRVPADVPLADRGRVRRRRDRLGRLDVEKELLSRATESSSVRRSAGPTERRLRERPGAPRGGDVRSRGRQLHAERAPRAGNRTDAHPTAVRVGDALDRGQAEADPRLAAVRTAHVRLEHLLAELGRQPRAVVLDLDPDARALPIRDRPARARRCAVKGRRPHI